IVELEVTRIIRRRLILREKYHALLVDLALLFRGKWLVFLVVPMLQRSAAHRMPGPILREWSRHQKPAHQCEGDAMTAHLQMISISAGSRFWSRCAASSGAM